MMMSMSRGLAVVILYLALAAMPAAANDVVRDDLQSVFEANGVRGGFAMLDADTGIYTVVNPERVEQRVWPASTFKIINAAIAIDAGAVQGVRDVIPYGGGPQRVESWQKDMTLAEAIAVSSVPIFQEVARRIGLDVYRARLPALGYGNGEVGTSVTDFWLSGPLAISPREQAQVLARFASTGAGFSRRAQQFVRAAIRQDEKDGAALFGKTGWNSDADPATGWFVGWVETTAGIKSFALILDVPDQAAADKREAVAVELLTSLGVW